MNNVQSVGPWTATKMLFGFIPRLIGTANKGLDKVDRFIDLADPLLRTAETHIKVWETDSLQELEAAQAKKEAARKAQIAQLKVA